MANLEIIFYIPNRFTTFFLKRYTALSFKTDMTARFCACNACRYFFLSYEFIEFIKLLRVVNLPSEGRLWQATHRWELMWHETNKKSPRWGGEGWRPIVCVKPKSNGKQTSPLSFAVTPTVTRDARHSPPSPLRKKSRFAEKKSASPKKNCAYSLQDSIMFVNSCSWGM